VVGGEQVASGTSLAEGYGSPIRKSVLKGRDYVACASMIQGWGDGIPIRKSVLSVVGRNGLASSTNLAPQGGESLSEGEDEEEEEPLYYLSVRKPKHSWLA
jgi:hypothetical protein